MAMHLTQAKELKIGDRLTFGNEWVYTVTGVAVRDGGKGVRLSLLRGDGYDTFATEHDLAKAKLLRPAGKNDAGASNVTSPYDSWTRKQLEAELIRRSIALKERGGSGSGGSYLVADLAAILIRQDAGFDNP